MNSQYHPEEIESSLQKTWSEEKRFEVKEDPNKEKFYCLAMLPYPSGEMHMGHVRNYTISDVIARYQSMLGKNVLHPMGWDAFGLPAENAAIQKKVPPAEWTYKNIETLKAQLQRLGFSFDWSRELATCKPEYYRWEQWLFIQLYKKGLVERKKAKVNWDPVDQTVLANEQVIDGKGWRSGALVEQREISQWFLKITEYADELLKCLDEIDWPDQVKTMQNNWIGRSEGMNIHFNIDGQTNLEPITIYTTCPHTVMGVNFIGIAPEHPLVDYILAQKDPAIQKFVDECHHGSTVSEADFAKLDKKGIYTNLSAIHPLTGKKVPIWIANYVLMEYGSGAVMSVPAHDERDFEFSQKYNLPFEPVVQPDEEWDFSKQAYTGPGTLINSSAQFDGLKSNEAYESICNELTKQKKGEKKVRYRLRDWGISRQRYWGAPIPMIHCPNCGVLPVPESDLPVVLPEELIPEGTHSPLSDLESFYKVDCPSCKKPARRETDTFDTFFESSWYYARYTCPDSNSSILDDRANYWLPVDQYVGGIEHAVMHLLYARFLHKTIRDIDFLKSDEPFTKLLTQGMVLKDGAKMSKSKGNTVSPNELIENYGADTVRLFSIFAAPPEHSLEWSDSGVEGAYRFLKRLWTLSHTHQAAVSQENTKPSQAKLTTEEKAYRAELYRIFKQADFDMKRQQYNTVVSAGMKIINLIGQNKKAVENSALLSESISLLVRLLHPIVPHITEHLWSELKYPGSIEEAGWPKIDTTALNTDEIKLAVQINGKRRGEISATRDASSETLENLIKNDAQFEHWLKDQTMKKVIVVPNRLINIII